MDERLERHLCNLHNEVFEAAESRINTECSLIICEGISKSLMLLVALAVVPSLYVRVYRSAITFITVGLGSLIICEGISPYLVKIRSEFLFPHYM